MKGSPEINVTESVIFNTYWVKVKTRDYASLRLVFIHHTCVWEAIQVLGRRYSTDGAPTAILFILETGASKYI